MAGHLFRLETVGGEPAEPPRLSAAVPNWEAGDSIYFGYKTPEWSARGMMTTPTDRPS
jgi:hypothetical protein